MATLKAGQSWVVSLHQKLRDELRVIITQLNIQKFSGAYSVFGNKKVYFKPSDSSWENYLRQVETMQTNFSRAWPGDKKLMLLEMLKYINSDLSNLRAETNQYILRLPNQFSMKDFQEINLNFQKQIWLMLLVSGYKQIKEESKNNTLNEGIELFILKCFSDRYDTLRSKDPKQQPNNKTSHQEETSHHKLVLTLPNTLDKVYRLIFDSIGNESKIDQKNHTLKSPQWDLLLRTINGKKDKWLEWIIENNYKYMNTMFIYLIHAWINCLRSPFGLPNMFSWKNIIEKSENIGSDVCLFVRSMKSFFVFAYYEYGFKMICIACYRLLFEPVPVLNTVSSTTLPSSNGLWLDNARAASYIPCALMFEYIAWIIRSMNVRFNSQKSLTNLEGAFGQLEMFVKSLNLHLDSSRETKNLVTALHNIHSLSINEPQDSKKDLNDTAKDIRLIENALCTCVLYDEVIYAALHNNALKTYEHIFEVMKHINHLRDFVLNFQYFVKNQNRAGDKFFTYLNTNFDI